MDAFFAAVEQLDQPSLRGKPILVGSNRPRSVVTTASYAARPFGCRSGQPMTVAKRLCPQAIVVPVRGKRYRYVSKQLFAILDEFTPLVEPLSVDEAFLDMTGCEHLFGTIEQVARRIQQRIYQQLGLTASIGIAPNKFLSKIASEIKKPNGVTTISPDEIDRILNPLALDKIWGIGPVTARRLATLGINIIEDLRCLPLHKLVDKLGQDGERFYRLARGQDQRPVVPDNQAKSIGNEQTFECDMQESENIRFILLEQVEHVARRLRRHQLCARTITVKIRFGNFKTITRSHTLPTPTNASDELWHTARRLFDHWAANSYAPVRLIGVTASQLVQAHQQFNLFIDESQSQSLDQVKDQIKDRFGTNAIRRGLKSEPSAETDR